MMLVAFYAGANLLMPMFVSQAERKRRQAWVVTLLSSLIMSVSGVWYAVRLYRSNGDILIPGSVALDDVQEEIARGLTMFFLAYCVVDMLLAALFYNEEAGVAYEHHSLYIVIVI